MARWPENPEYERAMFDYYTNRHSSLPRRWAATATCGCVRGAQICGTCLRALCEAKGSPS